VGELRTVTDFPYAVRQVEHFEVPLSDGCRLAARLWLPEDAETNPVPAVLEYIPYRKRDKTANRDEINHLYMAGHGYACLRVDLRGSGESDGVLTDEYLQQELDDGVELLRWIGKQAWCTGSVGVIGKSWGGFNGLQLAAMRPPELAAVITLCSTDDRYTDDVHYMGGCLLGDNLSWASSMFANTSCPPDPALVGERWKDMWLQRLEGSGHWLESWLLHQRRDEYWEHGSICEDYDSVDVPVLAVSGWADGYSNSVFRMMANLRGPRQGLIGPWSHKYPHLGVPGPAIGFLQEAVRWWDHWLKGIDRGVMDEPILRAWMQDSVPPVSNQQLRPGRWVAEPAWPSPHVQERRYALGDAGLIPEDEAAGGSRIRTIQSPLSVGLYAGKWCSFTATPDLPHDQREEDGGALNFDTRPLEEPVEILGAPVVDLELSSDKPVAMIAVRLSDRLPDDRTTRVTYGLLNLTHRNSHGEPEPLVPGERYRVRVQLNDVAHRFPAGHRLRVAISTSYWPLAWPSPEPVRLTINPDESRLVLPVRAPRASDDDLRPFEPPEGAEPPVQTQTLPLSYSWKVIRDLARDESTLEVVKDEGATRLDDIDLELRSKTTEWYTYAEGDNQSVRGETRGVRRFTRGDWEVETITHTILTCTRDHFRLQADLDAYLGETRVFAKSWDRWIPRDCV
jgi:uncharacterized protein